MQFATDDNFPEICELFKKNRKFFPHIRMSKIAGAIERKECIFMDGVVIIFKIHKRSVRIGNNTVSHMRKTKASVIYNKTKNVDAVRRLLGQSSVTATSSYLGVTDNSALELARSINI